MTVLPALTPPSQPVGLTVALRDGGLLVTFVPPIGEPDATYQISTDDGATWTDLEVTPAGDTVTGLITGLTNGTLYPVGLRAVNDGGPGDPADAVTGTPLAPAAAPMPNPPAVPPAGVFLLTTTDGAITTAEPGQEITFVGDGFAAFSTVVLSIYSDPIVLATVVTNAGGAFRQAVTVPADLAAGKHTILAQGVDADGNLRSLSVAVTVAVTVAAEETATPSPSLPTTGDSPCWPAWSACY